MKKILFLMLFLSSCEDNDVKTNKQLVIPCVEIFSKTYSKGVYKYEQISDDMCYVYYNEKAN